MNLAIVDTGVANTGSVRYALERAGVSPAVTADAEALRGADGVILPGVGSAAAAMAKLRARGLADTLTALSQPVLGICLGMQLLASASEEGPVQTLGIAPARVQRLAAPRLPHMGWNQLQLASESALTDGLDGAWMYFVHSYAWPVDHSCLASSEHGTRFAAVVQHGSFYGVQFHPERSADAGARLLRNFLALC